MVSGEKLNREIYKRLSEQFGLDVRICEQIMLSQFRLVKEKIADPDFSGAIRLPMFFMFRTCKNDKRRKSKEAETAPAV